jgi:transposase InsO family protein
MSNEHPVKVLCRSFEVSTSGYYDWRQRPTHPCGRVVQDEQLKQQIARIHSESRGTYGAPRIQFELAEAGQRHGRNRIGRLMREQQLCGRQKRRFRVRTTDSNHDEPIAPNRLAQRPAPTRPDEVWVADITYIWTAESWLYVAAILDLFSRRVVGWAVSQRIDTALVMAAWQMACTHRQPPAGLVFHSDRGVQYASRDYRRALARSQVVASMSRKANCYDNAVVEAFWSTLKLELVYRSDFATAAQAVAALFDYIEVFYNRRRRHSALGYRSPAEFEASNN